MSETSQFEDEVRKHLARQHDNTLAALMLNRRERRRRGLRTSKKDLERYLLATGVAIAKTGEQ